MDKDIWYVSQLKKKKETEVEKCIYSHSHVYHKVKKSVKQFVQYGFSFDLKLCVCIHMHRKNSKIYQQNCVSGRGVSGSVKFCSFLLSEFSAILWNLSNLFH